jgi:integrase
VVSRADISAKLWNRDLRAGAVTEGRQGGALTDDLAKGAGHASKRTTAKVYDRDQLEAQRRVMQARLAYRDKGETG